MGKIFKALQKAEIRKGGDVQPEVATPGSANIVDGTAEAVDLEQVEGVGARGAGEAAEIPFQSDQRTPSSLSLLEVADKITPDASSLERISEVEETAEGEGAPSGPQRPGRIDKRLITLTSPNSFESEQFKILRSTLLFPSSGMIPKAVLITSALPGEGKSFVASNLAVSIAQNLNNHVLLIDFDLRRPRVHRIFGYNRVNGLSELLADGASVPSILLKTEVDKLSILPGGNPPPNPSELLSSKQMTNLLFEVRARYDDRFILIDSPPPMTAETRAIARQVDGIILVVRQGKTKREVVQETIDKLGRDKVLGVVMNHTAMSASNYYARYRRYYNN